jgi:transposase
MQYPQGNDRDQMFMLSLEEAVAPDAFARVVDVFVDAIDFKSFEFTNTQCKEKGRPAYHPEMLMKLYLYGYRHGIRSSRKLQREAKTNMEAIWLLKGLSPHYKTIANFRKDNSRAFREVFRKFVLLLRDWDLIEGETVAIDSFKIRASNSLKSNFNEARLKRHLAYIDDQIDQYQAQLDAADTQEEKESMVQKIEERTEKRQHYQEVEDQLLQSGEQQISLTDPDARSVVLHRNIINVGYNIQAVCDEKHKLLVEYDTGSVNDTHALAPMALQTKGLLQTGELTVLADKGYHTGKQLHICRQNNIKTYVSPKAPSANTDSGYPITMFQYNPQTDTYTCPQGQTMQTNGKWYIHSNSRKGRSDRHRFRRYLTPACKQCGAIKECTRSAKNGRAIDRSEYEDVVESNNQRVTENPDYYRQRQQVTEHQFGTIKRQMGYTHTNIRGKPKLLGEIGMVFTVYNLVRCVRILGMGNFAKALKQRLYVILFLKPGSFWSDMRNLLFLLPQNIAGMRAA